MMGVEKLLQAMTGLSQAEMKEIAQKGIETIQSLDGRLSRIEAMITAIHSEVGLSTVELLEDKNNAKGK